MNRKRWQDPTIPLEVLALKLTEEAAEVGTEISDMHFIDRPNAWITQEQYKNRVGGRLTKALEELEHVEFIAGVLRARIEEAMPSA